MTPEERKVMELALEALEDAQGYIEAELNDRKSLYEPYGMDYKYKTEADDLAETKEAMTSLRQAIAEAEKQKPVAWVCMGVNDAHDIDFDEDDVNALPVGTMLYHHTQPKREWVGLTDEEMYINCPNWLSQEQCKVWIQQIEAKLKEKNERLEKNT